MQGHTQKRIKCRMRHNWEGMPMITRDCSANITIRKTYQCGLGLLLNREIKLYAEYELILDVYCFVLVFFFGTNFHHECHLKAVVTSTFSLLHQGQI